MKYWLIRPFLESVSFVLVAALQWAAIQILDHGNRRLVEAVVANPLKRFPVLLVTNMTYEKSRQRLKNCHVRLIAPLSLGVVGH